MEIRVQNLSKAYRGKPVLDRLSFTAGPGVLCVMAPSGTGKTTLLRLLLGLEAPDSGAVVTDPAPCRWAAVFQEDRLLEGLDARANLRFVLGSRYDPRAAEALLGALGLEAPAGKMVSEFSGGMKRRLALARALLADSDALALDEPFTGLDDESRARALGAIRQYAAGKPVLLVTHDRRDAQAAGAAVLDLPQR